jgi:hypothetical protein
MAVSSSVRALRIDTILDEVIWLMHAGGCSSGSCSKAFTLSFPYGCHLNGKDHLHQLLKSILVCKHWAAIAKPQLWGHYATDRNLLSIISDIPHWTTDYYKTTGIFGEVVEDVSCCLYVKFSLSDGNSSINPASSPPLFSFGCLVILFKIR